MTEDDLLEIVPKPFLYNALKHQKAYVLQVIGKLKSGKEIDASGLDLLINKTGRQMVDFYYGLLTPGEITGEIKHILEDMQTFHEMSYHDWLASTPKKFRNIEISDGSVWTLLQGEVHDRYIHIHPARYSKHTIRVRSLALKTAVFLLAFRPAFDDDLIGNMNFIRREFLKESPVKGEKDTRHIRKVLHILLS